MFAAEFETVTFRRRRRSMDAAATAAEGEPANDGLARALCKVLQISREGVQLQTYIPLVLKSVIRLYLPETDGVMARVVSASDFSARCRFRRPLSPELLDELSSQNWEIAKAWLASRRELG
ncbi:PilZ domain-containing protein [Sphingomonas sp. GM_Shp_1]|uniref:PilZ domain-containing protein n=1 Tax=Sphingomonas sp. GM_Shp_1 TaxID=2937381 RepID=UPI00226B9692|nr:PilZ domain-containing protein [Sphingomonas sp. GM_Shp_1]